MQKKVRLDTLLVAKGLVPCRKLAQSIIISGDVLVNDKVIDKAGTKIGEGSDVRIKWALDEEFVSRAGKKLKAALESFEVDVTGFSVLDAGASTGGFTDCLLKRGAKKVYAVDVGYGQLAYSLQTDKRVVVIDRTNIRHMERNRIPEELDLAVVDLSFISLKKVLNNITNFVKSNGNIIALIKPQFEAGREKVGKGGIVKDPKVHENVIEDIKIFCKDIGLTVSGVMPSPILGTKGNKEFLINLKK
jgi:23S rRNA (cytidine1920-2'-O)/16S rRNA (cytidine1409-2'-O)-methyltransferase